MNTLELTPPEAVREIAQKLEKAGFETWAVGGAVRDSLLGMRGNDWDLATSARPRDVQKTFKRTVPVGIDHGTVGVLARDGKMYEVTTFRRDVETFGRHAVVSFADTIDEDLSRRDFTFNAIAWHPLTHELRDPFKGFEDLRAARLQTVGEPADRFAEDYLRILRALRFAGHFVLKVEPATWSALTSTTGHLVNLSAERVREELWKILTKSPHASAALKLYAEAGVLTVLYPELDALVTLEQETGEPHWTRSLAAVDELPVSRPALRMAALLHGIGRPPARTRDLRGEWRYTGHEVRGGRDAETIMRRLKASNADIERVSTLVARQSDLFPPDAPDAGVRRWLLHVPPRDVRDLFRLRFALARAAGNNGADLIERWHHVHRVLMQNPVLEISRLAIGGRDLKALGIAPGPEFGAVLNSLLDKVIDDPALNEHETLMTLARAELPQ